MESSSVASATRFVPPIASYLMISFHSFAHLEIYIQAPSGTGYPCPGTREYMVPHNIGYHDIHISCYHDIHAIASRYLLATMLSTLVPRADDSD